MNYAQAAKDRFKLILNIKSKKISTRIWDVTAYDNTLLLRARIYNSSKIITRNYHMKCISQNLVNMKRADYDLKTNLEIKRYLNSKAVKGEDVTSVLNKDLLESKLKNNKYYDLLSILTNVNYLVKAYTLIKSKPGNMTKGLDNETLDRINIEYFNKLSELLRTGKYNFKPGRASLIPKANSDKLRQLTVMSPRDKIVHKAITMLLESI